MTKTAFAGATAVLIDLDGCIYAGDAVVPNAAESVSTLREVWDAATVRDRQGYGEEPSEYVRYISDKWKEFWAIADRPPRDMIVKEHAAFLNSRWLVNAYEPITKLLDETNYIF
jgi:hypothetical protein